jgi:transglutaminase-like putative cysteine protease
LRSLGYPARYVSGYLETIPPAGEEKLIGADATHAWFSVYSPGEGWYQFDPTNNKVAGEQHITTAWGRDYSDVTPVKGVIFGGGQAPQLFVSVDVQRVNN